MRTRYIITVAEMQGDRFVYPILKRFSNRKTAERALLKLDKQYFVCTEVQYDVLYTE